MTWNNLNGSKLFVLYFAKPFYKYISVICKTFFSNFLSGLILDYLPTSTEINPNLQIEK